MTLPTKTPAQLTADQIATFSAITGVTPVFQSGNATLALFQTQSIQMDFLQALIVDVVNLTRAQTSTGADLDSWMAQFAFTRLPPTYAAGPVICSTNQPAVNPIAISAATLGVDGLYHGGTIVQTSNGGTQYQVIPNTAAPTWNAGLNAYVLATGQTTLTATVQALLPGSASNVAANQLVQFGTPVPIENVTNDAPIQDGSDAESDVAFRARFILYLATLAKATRAAIIAAAMSVQQGLQISTFENQDPEGNPVAGSFTVFVDDGTGDPPSQLIDNVYAAVDAVRAFGIQPFVSAPNITTLTIVITIHVADGFDTPTVKTAAANAIAAAVNVLLAGATAYVSTVEGAALSVPGCAAVQPGTLLNGSNADLTPASNVELRTGLSHITVDTY